MMLKTASTLVIIFGLIIFCGAFATTYFLRFKNKQTSNPPVSQQNTKYPPPPGFDSKLPRCTRETSYSGIHSALLYAKKVCALNIHKNELPALAQNASSFSSLQLLSITNENIDSIPLEIGSIKTLQVLDLRSNNLTSLPIESMQSMHLKMIVLSDNPFSNETIKKIKEALPNTVVVFITSKK